MLDLTPPLEDPPRELLNEERGTREEEPSEGKRPQPEVETVVVQFQEPGRDLKGRDHMTHLDLMSSHLSTPHPYLTLPHSLPSHETGPVQPPVPLSTRINVDTSTQKQSKGVPRFWEETLPP